MLPSELLESMHGVVGYDEKAFIAAHDGVVPHTSIRLNQVKIAQYQIPSTNQSEDKNDRVGTAAFVQTHPALAEHKPVPWCPLGYYLHQRPSFTHDPLFHAGAYYVQEASSMFLWSALAQCITTTVDGLIVLDLCAAPGGKTTLLSSFFQKSLLVSNEVIKSRASILVENTIKWGSGHLVVTNNDPSHFAALTGFFDVIIIDAPCSGSGLFRKDANAVQEWSVEQVALCSKRQIRIVTDVWPALKEGGLLIYSTCSFSPVENEAVVDTILEALPSTTIQLNAQSGIVETLSPQLGGYGYRFYPHLVDGEGFYMAAVRKANSNQPTVMGGNKFMAIPSKQEAAICNAFIPMPADYFMFKQGQEINWFPLQWKEALETLVQHLYIKNAGITLGEVKGKDCIPHHQVAMYQGLDKSSIVCTHFSKDQALLYLKRQEMQVEGAHGWNLACYQGLALGWLKILPNRINNYYPTSWRILKD